MPDPLCLGLRRSVAGYAIGQVLGVGSFGEVRLGQNLTTGDIVAIKIIPDQVDRDPDTFEKTSQVSSSEQSQFRLKNEVAILKRLNHVHISQMIDVVYDVAISGNWCSSCACSEYSSSRSPGRCQSCAHDQRGHSMDATRSATLIVMELAMGGELFSVIHDAGPLPESIARLYFRQLCLALQHCHTNGVAHRDLRLENLVLDHHLNLKLIDFGLSARVDPFPPEGRPIRLDRGPSAGQILYSAPESLLGDEYLAEPADIWSSAVILFIILTGRPPFRRPYCRTINSSQQRCEHFCQLQSGRYPDSISEPTRRLLMSMFDLDPAKRPSLDAILQDEWVQGPISDARETTQYLQPIVQRIHVNQNKQCLNNVLRRLSETDLELAMAKRDVAELLNGDVQTDPILPNGDEEKTSVSEGSGDDVGDIRAEL